MAAQDQQEREFVAHVDRWVAQTRERITAVFRESTQRVIARMQVPVGGGGNMPVDTGFLRASVRASLSQMPAINPEAFPPEGAGENSVAYDDSVVVLTIAQAQFGQTIYVGYTAAYAGFQEARRGFVRLAAMEWPRIVSEVSQEARQRASQVSS